MKALTPEEVRALPLGTQVWLVYRDSPIYPIRSTSTAARHRIVAGMFETHGSEAAALAAWLRLAEDWCASQQAKVDEARAIMGRVQRGEQGLPF